MTYMDLLVYRVGVYDGRTDGDRRLMKLSVRRPQKNVYHSF